MRSSDLSAPRLYAQLVNVLRPYSRAGRPPAEAASAEEAADTPPQADAAALFGAALAADTQPPRAS